MSKKLLIAFDFDHTIIDGNSDTVVRELLHKQPPGCKPGECWTTYMQNIFKLLHSQGVQQSSLLNAVANISPTMGMLELFQFLHRPEIDIIIISDSNSIFIQSWLSTQNLQDIVRNVYTNPAYFDTDGLLNISMYHSQNWCKLCPENLCKGSVLDSHLKKMQKEGVSYFKVAYVGDGKNDYCPSKKFSEIDHVFPRKGYYLEKFLKSMENQLPGNKEEDQKRILADICIWNSGSDIILKLSDIL